jgi:hypothetical protein
MHHNIYHLWSMHGVASSSKIRRLTVAGCESCASSTHASYFIHFLCAYIASIIILASWCMPHLVSIMVIAMWHMHHFDRAWNPPSSCCTIIAIIHLNRISCSWLYIKHCTLSWSILSLSLDCIGINRHVLQSTSSKSFR